MFDGIRKRRKKCWKLHQRKWKSCVFYGKKSPARSAGLVAELEDSCDWRPTTIKTLLARLTQKGAVKAAPLGEGIRAGCLYEPIITEDQYIAAESEELKERCFHNNTLKMLRFFVRQSHFTKEELVELRQLVALQQFKLLYMINKRKYFSIFFQQR